MTLHAKITAHKGILAIELLTTKNIDGEVSINTPWQAIENTKQHLGVSNEALELLKTIEVGQSILGDICWSDAIHDQQDFVWHGSHFTTLFDPKSAKAGRDHKVSDSYVLIDNDVPESARGIIEAILGSH